MLWAGGRESCNVVDSGDALSALLGRVQCV